MTRIIALLYGFASYALGLASLAYAVGFISGLVVPKTVDTGEAVPVGVAIAIDGLLIALFAAQHSIMARQGFKSWWTRFVPASVERSTYVLFSGLVLMLVFWQWRPLPSVVWSLSDPVAANVVTGLSLIGWLLAVASTFLINHFELFGVQQVTNNLLGKDMPAPRFSTPLFYRVVRHPLYLGLLIAFWAAPTMTFGHLLFAGLTTAYILAGAMLEERDLIALFGDDYRRYKASVPMLLPYGTSKDEGAVRFQSRGR
jgi:methanethiol S-methyltransferase